MRKDYEKNQYSYIYILYFTIYWKSGKKLESDRKLSKICLILMIYGLFENHVMNIGVNYLLIIQTCYFLRKRRK